MSGSINLSDLVKKPSKPTRSRRRVPSLSDESDSYRNTEIDLTSDSIHKEPVKKEEVVNSPINDRSEQFIKGVSKKEQLKRKDKKLEKIEKKTDKLIAKAKKPAPIKKESAKTKNVSFESIADDPWDNDTPCYEQYELMRKVPRLILDYCRENISYNTNLGYWLVELDTAHVLKELSVSKSSFTSAFYRLRKKGWFLKIKSHSGDSGHRTLQMDPSLIFTSQELIKINDNSPIQ